MALLKASRFTFLILYTFIFVLFSCNTEELTNINSSELDALPKDEGGEILSHAIGSTESPYGYNVYLPSCYNNENVTFPVLVYLHSQENSGDGGIGAAGLGKLLTCGPNKLISNNNWDAEFPMVVVSPQSTTNWMEPDSVKLFIDYLIDNYKLNTERIYMTGSGMGGYGIYWYVGKYGNDSKVAAVVPIRGAGKSYHASGFKNIPVWAFHGEEDKNIPLAGSVDIISSINDLSPDYKAKLTVYPDVDHNSESITYDGSGMGAESDHYSPFNQEIYRWMRGYKRNADGIVVEVN